MKFDLFRKVVIQKIYIELPNFFEEEEDMFMLISVLNGCFSIFDQQIIEKVETNSNFEKTEIFQLLFYTACFIVVKVKILS